MASRVITKATNDGGRSVKVAFKNQHLVAEWLGDALVEHKASVFTSDIKLKLKTPKGVRVAGVNDVIVKHGTRRNGGKVTFTVVKAS